MSYTEVEDIGWFSRIKESIQGIGCGLLLFILAFPVLWWNEGRAVMEATGIAAGEKSVIAVAADKVDQANEGKLIYVSGPATTKEKLVDEVTRFETEALRLRRKVEIFQWEESSTTKREKKLGGGEQKVTKYEYKQSWVSKPIPSGSFKEQKEHTNTGTLPFEDATVDSKNGQLGAFKLGPATGSCTAFEPASTDNQPQMKLPDGFKVAPTGLYKGADPAKAAIGDIRVTFEVVKPGDLTIVAGQKGDSFTSYKAAGKDFFIVQKGIVPKEKIFSDLKAGNAMMTWILRAVGFFMMVIGIAVMLKPLSVLADVIPFIGNFVEFGAGMVGFSIALPLTLLTIGIAWVAHRPALGIGLLVVGGLAFFFLGSRLRKPSS